MDMKESTVKTSLYHRNGNEKRGSNDGVFQLSGGFREEKRVLKDVSMKIVAMWRECTWAPDSQVPGFKSWSSWLSDLGPS